NENVALILIVVNRENLEKIKEVIESIKLLNKEIYIVVKINELSRVEELLVEVLESKRVKILIENEDIKREIRSSLFEYTIKKQDYSSSIVSEAYVDKINWILKIKKFNRFKKLVQKNLIDLNNFVIDECHYKKEKIDSEHFSNEMNKRLGEEGSTNNLIWLLELLDSLTFASANPIIFKNEIYEVIRALEQMSKIFIELKYFDKLSSALHKIKDLVETYVENISEEEKILFLSSMIKNLVIDLEELVLNIFIRGNIKDINYLDDSIIGIYYQTEDLLNEISNKN
ncbi:hypothetical protein HOK00_04970, partial [bacterium]|nr:hypothetical protein [bacterium]